MEHLNRTAVHVSAVIQGNEAEAKVILDRALAQLRRLCPDIEITRQEVKASAAHLLISDLPREDVSLHLGNFLCSRFSYHVGNRVAGATLGAVAAVTENQFKTRLSQYAVSASEQDVLYAETLDLLKKHDLSFAQ